MAEHTDRVRKGCRSAPESAIAAPGDRGRPL